MSEGQVIETSGVMRTSSDLVAALQAMGLRPGDVVLAHVGLSRLGWVLGGAPTVVEAILQVIGPEGTLCMPGNTGHLSDPADWQNPPVPADWHNRIREDMPLFDPQTTPPRGTGAVANTLWHWPGTRRSRHPQVSMLAQGARADDITRHHPLDNAMGPEAPLGRIHELGGRVLMLGVDYLSCTALHLVEYRLDLPTEMIPMPVDRQGGRTIWQEVTEPQTLHARFAEVGQAFEAAHPDAVRRGLDGAARLIDMGALVEFAEGYFRANSMAP